MTDLDASNSDIPRWVLKWGGIAWRALAMGAVVFFAFEGIKRISAVAIAVVLALFLASVLWGPVHWLVDRAGWPPLASTLTVFVVALALFAAWCSSPFRRSSPVSATLARMSPLRPNR